MDDNEILEQEEVAIAAIERAVGLNDPRSRRDVQDLTDEFAAFEREELGLDADDEIEEDGPVEHHRAVQCFNHGTFVCGLLAS